MFIVYSLRSGNKIGFQFLVNYIYVWHAYDSFIYASSLGFVGR